MAPCYACSQPRMDSDVSAELEPLPSACSTRVLTPFPDVDLTLSPQIQSCCDATYVNGVRLTRGTMRQLHHADAIVLGVCAHVFVFVQPATKPGQMRSMSVDLANTSLMDDGLTPPGAGEGGDGSLGGFRAPGGAPARGLAKGGSFNTASAALNKSSSGE